METIGTMRSYQDSSRGGYIPTSSDDRSSPQRPAFQRCHRLQARLEAVSAGLCELNMLRERQERLVKEAMCLPLSCVDDGEEEEVGKEADSVNKQECEGKFNEPPQLVGDLKERLDLIGVVNSTPDVSINSETSSRKSSGFFEAFDTDVFEQSRKNSVAEYSDICPDITTSGEVRMVEESSRKVSDGDASSFVRNRAESSSLPDHNAITRAKFAWSISNEKVIASENREAESVRIKRSLSMKTARKLSYSGETSPESKSTMDGSVSAKSRPCSLQRSISVPEPRTHVNTESISREELIRRKRRSVHEIDFSLHGQPGLASQCYMGSSRAFRYPSPLHAISLQSPLCLPGPGYHEKQKERLVDRQTDVDSTQATISRNQSGAITEENSKVVKSEHSFEVINAESQASTKAHNPSPAADDLTDRSFSPTKCDTKAISHSGKMKETSPLSSRKNSVSIDKEKSQNTTHHVLVDNMEHRNQSGTNSLVDKTHQKPRSLRKGVREQDIGASFNYNTVTSYDGGSHSVCCEEKPSNLDKISSKEMNFKRSQNDFDFEKGDARYTRQTATARQEYFEDTIWLYPGRKSEYRSRENRHISVRSNFCTARNSDIDSNGHYNDGVVRSKTPVCQSLSRADGRQSGVSPGMKESQRVAERFDDRKQDVPRPQPKRKNACVTPVEIWRVEYGV